MMDGPNAVKRDGRQGHDQNKAKLQLEIDKGYQQFKGIAETIRMLELDSDTKGSLIVDFKKFRDIMAHKGVENLIFYQMLAAFVMYCRDILELTPVSYQPASTRQMNKTFARMADINVVVCAEWFLCILHKDLASRQKIARWMNREVKNSTFSHLTFENDEDRKEIVITYGVVEPSSIGDALNLEEKTPLSFSMQWLDSIYPQVLNSSITYGPDEIEELRQCYQKARELM